MMRTTAIISAIWRNPPKVRRVIRPSSHKTKRIIPITNNIWSILTSFMAYTEQKWLELCRLQQPVADPVPPESSLPEVRYESHYADDDKIDTNQIVEYLGEDHNNNPEYEACYSHPQTQSWPCNNWH
jgi:hypothetical protein